MPRAFFGTFFRFERKYYPRRGGSPTVRAGVGASSSTRGKGYAPAGAPKGFPRGKQSARFALPCAPLVVCLNSESLTAFGGCIHWIPASLRSPLETFGHRSWRENHGTAVQRPHRSRRINPPEGKLLQESWFSALLAYCFPRGKQSARRSVGRLSANETPAHSAANPQSCTPNPTEWIFS